MATLPHSVLIIGSGPIVIGQAAEFDYSGTQVCLACREAGVRTILVNSNPATIQTDPHVADTVWIEPLTVPSLREVIARERPEGLIATAGGQTALNLAVSLAEAGVLDVYDVRILGTGLEAIRRGEDRALFAGILRAIGQPLLPSRAATSVEEALQIAAELGYPVMCRAAFALGGAGSGIAHTADELVMQAALGLRSSGSGQVLVEQSVQGWSEIEYEVVRDSAGNCLIVCNMENVDPMGVHTGDSIVAAPSQTLSDEAYHLLRHAAIAIVEALGVEGACNVQFAYDRYSGRYFIIEVNPRLSRSSALASKATGYPIAKVAARIALGFTLPEIRNDITGTSAFFEPALDYVTVKVPRWPFDKFSTVSTTISTRMRSTGEVMAIGRTFEEAVDKAIRSLDYRPVEPVESNLLQILTQPTSGRLPAVLSALRLGWPPDQVATLSSIHPWFIDRLAAAARQGSSDAPIYKMVDTCAAEFEARTPYFYGTYSPGGWNEAESLPGPKAIILGAGPIRIGQGIEFDYATVHACHALSEAGIRSVIVNNNPETVSTDYATSDRLYFEPLDFQAVYAVIQNEAEGLCGVIPQFGGQTAINLVGRLAAAGVTILGTPPDAIDCAEDRERMSALLTEMAIPIPAWEAVHRWDDLPRAAAQVGLPALIRPSYVLSGHGMTIVHTPAEVEAYLASHRHRTLDRPILVDHFLDGATELDVDTVSDGWDTISVVMEQIEECGVHSGDSMSVYPVQTLPARIAQAAQEYVTAIARRLGVIGLMNTQLAVLDGTVYVLEVNPRASRSVPFASKASGIPLADLAIQCILGKRLSEIEVSPPRTDQVSVKGVVFPFRVFPELPPLLGPEMQSTGESMGTGGNFANAYWKAQLGAGWKGLPHGHPVYISLPPGSDVHPAIQAFQEAGCAVRTHPGMGAPGSIEPDLLEVASLGLAVVLTREAGDIDLLRRAVAAGVPIITTQGGLQAVVRAIPGVGERIAAAEPLRQR